MVERNGYVLQQPLCSPAAPGRTVGEPVKLYVNLTVAPFARRFVTCLLYYSHFCYTPVTQVLYSMMVAHPRTSKLNLELGGLSCAMHTSFPADPMSERRSLPGA